MSSLLTPAGATGIGRRVDRVPSDRGPTGVQVGIQASGGPAIRRPANDQAHRLPHRPGAIQAEPRRATLHCGPRRTTLTPSEPTPVMPLLAPQTAEPVTTHDARPPAAPSASRLKKLSQRCRHGVQSSAAWWSMPHSPRFSSGWRPGAHRQPGRYSARKGQRCSAAPAGVEQKAATEAARGIAASTFHDPVKAFFGDCADLLRGAG